MMTTKEREQIEKAIEMKERRLKREQAMGRSETYIKNLKADLEMTRGRLQKELV